MHTGRIRTGFIKSVRRDRRGTAALEFGLAVPLLLTLIVGLTETGMAAFEAMQVKNAAEAGVVYPVLLDITLTALDSDVFGDVFNSPIFNAFWGTGDCNNDSFYMANIDPPQNVPEPASLILFASGLFALGSLRLRAQKSGLSACGIGTTS